MSRDVDFWLRGGKVQNFGDFLSAWLMRTLFLPAPATGRTLRLIGSCIEDRTVPPPRSVWGRWRRKPVFWGCGLRQADGLSPERRDSGIFLAVRGPLTRDALQLPADTPVADPALLLPCLHRPPPRRGNTSLLVPHIYDRRDDAELRALTGCARVLRPSLPNLLAAIGDFIDQIASAEFVLCGALHAAITAVAYGTPFAFWDSGRIDLPFKWRDFAASVGITAEFAPDLAAGRAAYERIAPDLTIPVLWPLLAAAPLPVRPDRLIEVVRADLARHGQAALTQEMPLAGAAAIPERQPSQGTGFTMEKKLPRDGGRAGFAVAGAE